MPLTNIQAGLIGTGVQNLGNIFSQLIANKQSVENQQKLLDYNSAMTQAQWERDDSAHQREVADLEKAGLSPLASLGGLSTSQPLGSSVSPIQFHAPQFDSSSFVQSAISQNNNKIAEAEVNETVRHNLEQEKQTNSKLYYEGQQIEINAKQLKLDDEKLQHQIVQDSRIYSLEDKQINELIRHNGSIEELQKNEQELKKLSTMSDIFYKHIEKATGGQNVPVKVYTKDQLQDYLNYRQIRLKAYNGMIEDFDVASSSTSASGSVSLNKGKSRHTSMYDTYKQKSFGRSDKLGNSEGLSVSGSGSYARDKSFNYEKQIEAFNNQWPFPVYWPYEKLPYDLEKKEKKND